MKEFELNKYLAIKSENNLTVLYVNSEWFAILEIPKNSFFDEIDPIDEPLKLDRSLSPKTRFLWHYAKMQAWVKNNYDIRLLNNHIYFSLLKELAIAGDFKAKKVFKEEILKRLKTNKDKNLRFILENHYLENFYLDFFTQDEFSFIYKNYVSKFESLGLLLSFLRSLPYEKILDVKQHYRSVVKNILLTNNYKQKGKALDHLDVLEETDLVSIFEQLRLINTKISQKSQRFRVLSILMDEIENRSGPCFSILEISQTLLVEDEQTPFLSIFISSEFPWLNLNFQADIIRRRTWEEELYFHILDGHVISIELYYDPHNSEKFYDNLQKLKNFKNLNNLNLLISSDYSDHMYNLIKNSLLNIKNDFDLNKLKNVLIYDISEKFFYLNKISVM